MASGTITGTATVTSGTSAISVRLVWSSVQAVDGSGNLIPNTSTVTASYQMKRNATNYSSSSTFFITINGNTKNDTNGYTYPADNAWHQIMSHTVNVTHTSNGSKSIVLDAGGVNSGTSWLTSSFAATTVALDDYTILPTTPSVPTVTRPVSGLPTSITIQSGSSTFYGSSPDFKLQVSTDNATWYSIDGVIGSETSMGSDGSYTWTTATQNSSYYFRTRAYDTEGYSSWSASTFVAGTPNATTAPIISNVVTTNLTLSWTAPATNGSAISSYTIQATTNDGGTWSNIATGITTTSKDLTGLTIAATYKFRIIAINTIGASTAGTASASQFISAYGYRFTSSTAKTAIKTAARYTGNEADSIVIDGTTYTKWKALLGIKKFNGTSWTSLEQ